MFSSAKPGQPTGKTLRSVSLRYRHALSFHGKPCPFFLGPRGPSVGQHESESEDQPAEKLARLHAVLFLAKEPLPTRKLSQYANLADGTEARTLVGRLNAHLDGVGRAFRVEQVAGGYQLVTRSTFARWLRRLEYIPGQLRLSAPAMETLAVVAYRQPVLRADVEAVRGVGCGEILAQLLSRDLIHIKGRSEELGRPYLYSTTKRFLQEFGLKSLDELPRSQLWQESPQEVDQTTGAVHADDNRNGRNEQAEEEIHVNVSLEDRPPSELEETRQILNIALDSETVLKDDELEEEEYEDDDEGEEDDDFEEEEDDDEEYEYEDDDDADYEDDDDEEYEDEDDEDLEDDEIEDDEEEEDEEDEYEEGEWEEVDDDVEDDDEWEEDDEEWDDEEEWDEEDEKE